MGTAELAARLLATADQPGVLVDLGDATSAGGVLAINAAARAMLAEAPWFDDLARELASLPHGEVSGVLPMRDSNGEVVAHAGFASHQLDARHCVVWLSPDSAQEVVRERTDDPVTGLPALAPGRAERRRTADGGGVVLLGLDVRSAGGEVLDPQQLSAVGEQLSGVLRDGDSLTHLGAGRFAMLMSQVPGFDDVRMLESRLGHAAARALPGSPSPTVAVATDLDLDLDVDIESSLVRLEALLAEAASTHQTVRTGLGGDTRGARLPVAPDDVRRALAEGELRLHFQPVVDVHDRRAGGAEALLRWQHPTRGLLAPRHFLDMAEASVGAVALGEWVMEAAVRHAAAWDSVADLTYYRVGINLPPTMFVDTDVAGTMAALLDRYGVPGQRFAVEILESEALRSPQAVSDSVLRLRALGLRVAIDDFGNGFATASRLRDLPVDLVKVDRSLVGLAPTSEERALLAAVCSVARSMGADVLLEGVERQAQLVAAREAGVTFAQGMLIGPPVPPGSMPPRPLGLWMGD